MKYLSVCSGIEAATCAWRGLGWTPFAFSEIEPFPSAVLAHHYPNTPNLGDMTKFKEWPDADANVLVGGTPCQSFSVAGLRKGLADPRGNLMLTYLAIADRYRPGWVVWENVPGVLSSNSGRDFGTFLGALGELGYGWAYRTLDAQYFGVAQRRRRVFVVGCLGDWRRAAAVLFERESLLGNPAPGREKGKAVAGTVAPCIDASFGRLQGCSGQDANHGHAHLVAFGGNDTRGAIDVATACNAHGGPMGRLDFESETFVAHSLRGEGFDASEDGTGRGTPLVPIAIQGAATRENPASGPDGVGVRSDGMAYTLEARQEVQAVAFQSSQSGVRTGEVHATLDSNNGSRRHNGAVQGMQVRRLTPRECERLQGFPDDYTLIPLSRRDKKGETAELLKFALATGQDPALFKWSADGPRYKALGNSMAVPVMRWIGERIQMVETI